MVRFFIFFWVREDDDEDDTEKMLAWRFDLKERNDAFRV
jgi:hypothetical protein